MGLGVVWGFFIPDVGQCLKGCVTQTRSDSLLLAQLCQWHQQCPGAGILWVLSFGGFSAPPFQGLYLGQSQPGLAGSSHSTGAGCSVGFVVGLWGLWQGKVLDHLQGRCRGFGHDLELNGSS